jgi:hypothetical protein
MVGTRSPYPDNTWAGTEEVYIYIDGAKYEDDSPVSATTPYKFLVGSDGRLTPPVRMFWPDNDGTVTVYGYYSNPDLNDSQTPYTIQTDQSGDGLAKSDFLYAPTVSMKESNHNDTAQGVKFFHQEAEIVINLSVSTGYLDPKPDLDKVSLRVNGYTAKIPDPTSPDATNPTKCCQWSGAGTEGFIKPHRDSDKFTVLLAPRSMVKDDVFLEITNTNNGTKTTTYKLPEAFNILSGHTYTLDAIIQQGGVAVQIIGDTDPSSPLVDDPTNGSNWSDGKAGI